MLDIFKELKDNKYPGRGIILGKSKDGESGVMAYFIMGRSENSRNRVFAEDGLGVKTQAFDASKLTDPSLVIYSAVRVLGDCTIVTNGDQTDTIYDFLSGSASFERALMTRTFEPDAPNFTPRISGLCAFGDGGMSIKMSILKSTNEGAGVCRQFFCYDGLENGQGYFIHTYKSDGSPLPSFEGEPKQVEIKEDLNEFSQNLWNALDDDNKVSLFVRFVNLKTGSASTKIINKLSK